MFFEIGSKPLADMGVLPRKPSDIDWFGPLASAKQILSRVFPLGYTVFSENNHKLIVKANLSGGKHVMVEIENSDENENNQKIYRYMLLDSQKTGMVTPASLDMLLFFKESHKYKKNSVHFLKTMQDILLLKSLGAVVPAALSAELAERERLTYTNKLPVLDVSKKDFFNPQTVPYKYDHDVLHKIVAVDSEPAYTKYLKDGSEVLTDKGKFFAVDHRVRILGGMEEAMVLALERSQIPFGIGKTSPAKSFTTALEKVCTSITGGYFREFCYTNYSEILRTYFELGEWWYVQKFKEALEDGKIVPWNP